MASEWLNEFQANLIDSGPGGNDQFDSQVVQLSNGDILVAWASNTDPAGGAGSSINNDIIGRIFDPYGTPVTGEIQLNSITGGFSTAAAFPGIDALPGGGFTVTYRSAQSSISNVDLSLEADVYNNSGTFQRHIDIQTLNNLPSASGRLEEPVVAAVSDTSAMVVYGDNGDVMGTVYNPSTGAIISSNFLIANQTTGDFQGADVATYGNGNYIIAFADRDSGNDELYYAYYNAFGTAVTVNPILINDSFPDAENPNIAVLSNGDFVVSWEVDGSGGSNNGVRFAIMENILFGFSTGAAQNPLTTVAGNQLHSNIVGLEDGGFIVAWYDENTHDLRAQQHENDGTRVGTEFIMANFNNFTINNIDMAQMEDGRIQISFTRSTTTNDNDVFTAIWDPRDEPNQTPVYDENIMIGTPDNDVVNPLPNPASFENVDLHTGNDTIWIRHDDDILNTNFEGGDGTDTFGAYNAGAYIFSNNGGVYNTNITGFEILKFNAGANNGQKGVFFAEDLMDQFHTIDFAQGGANKADDLVIFGGPVANWSIDLSGVNIVDFDPNFDRIQFLGDNGNETIVGTSVNDLIAGDEGLDYLDGSDGLDTLSNANRGAFIGDVTVDLDNGVMTSSDGTETILNFENFIGSDFNADNETIYGTDLHANRIEAGAGDDTLEGKGSADLLFGEDGDDTFIIRSQNDISSGPVDLMDGGAGTDTVAVGLGSTVSQTYNLRNESLVSIEEIDFLGQFGGGGTDDRVQLSAFQFTSGDISLTANIDGYNNTGSTETLEVFMTNVTSLDLSDLTFTNWGGQNDLVRIVGDGSDEIIRGTTQNDEFNTGSGLDTLIGSGGNDTFNSGAGADNITIDASKDTVNAGTGDDRIIVTNFSVTGGHNIDGGGDSDTVLFTSFGQDYTIDLNAGTWTQDSSGNEVAQSLISIENVDAGNGNDTIRGTNGVNHLEGKNGNDLIEGGAGADILEGGANRDTVSYEGSNAGVGVRLADQTVDGGHATGDTISGFENATGSNFADDLRGDDIRNVLKGNDGDDVIRGFDGDDTLNGGLGMDRLLGLNDDDTMYGGTGDDTMQGGDGNDTMFGGDDDDYMIGGSGNDEMHGGLGNDTLQGRADTDELYGDEGDDILRGDSQTDMLYGGDDDDFIDAAGGADIAEGGSGMDTILGGGGSDMITGGTGNDITDGGTGNNTFIFNTDDGSDRIRDWSLGNNQIDFSNNTNFNNFADVQAAMIDQTNGHLRIDFDANNEILLLNTLSTDLNAGDFIF